MIVIIDTTKGQALNFTTRKDAGEFIGVSRPTLRAWLTKPFYLYKTLIITHTSNEKVNQSKHALLKKKMAKFRKEEIENVRIPQIQGNEHKDGDFTINDSRSEEPTEVAFIIKP